MTSVFTCFYFSSSKICKTANSSLKQNWYNIYKPYFDLHRSVPKPYSNAYYSKTCQIQNLDCVEISIYPNIALALRTENEK